LGHLFLLILFALLVPAPPAPAQQPSSQPPAPAPSSPQPSKSDQNSSDQDKNKQVPQEGKTKIEKETGTVNDRIFEVLPNFGTVENAKDLPPITSGQKFRLATAGVFDYAAYPFNGALAAISQAKNDPPSWGQGWGAYGKRYAISFGDNSIGTYMTTAIFPSILHEDPRYYQLQRGGFSHRAFYSASRLFVVRTDSGYTRFNYSETVGNGIAAGISNFYHVPDDRTVSRNFTTLGFLILYDGVSNELEEFWPDIRRKVFRKKTP
jgi:hypothetical protein